MNTESILAVVVELCAKSVALAAAGMLLAKGWRNATAAQRHLIGLVALAAILLLPVTRLVSPRWAIPLQPVKRVRIALPAQAAPGEIKLAPVLVPTLPTLAPPVSKPIDWRKLVLECWAAGAVMLLGHRLLGSWRLGRLLHRSLRADDPRIAILLSRTLSELGIRRRPEIRFSEECCVPVTWGSLRPVMLLPMEAMAWSDARLAAALRHEAAHIQRHDYLTRWLALLACAVYWPNPFIWLLARSLRVAQEQAADDLVLRAGTPADEYATQLVDAARAIAVQGFFVRQAVAMACPSTLEDRVRAIVDAARDRRPLSRMATASGVLALALALAVSTAAQLRSEDRALAAESGGKNSAVTTASGKTPQILISTKLIQIDPGVSTADVESLTNGATFSNAQFQALLRALSRAKGVDLLSAPTVTTKSNQRAIIEVVREMRCPTAWEKDAAVGGWKPEEFESKNVGVTVPFEPELKADGTIALHVAPTLTEFLGFVNLDNQKSVAAAVTRPGDLTAPDIGPLDPRGNRIKAVFSERTIDKSVTLKSDETVVFSDFKEVGDTRPFARPDPAPKLFVFITATLIDPASGKPVLVSDKAPEDALNPPASENALVVREWKVPANWMSAKPKSAGGSGSAAQDWLVSQGVKFEAGCSAAFFPESSRLVVRNTQAQLDLVDRIVSVAGDGGGAKPAAAPPGPALAKAQRIILPKIEFREATVSEILEFLRIKGAELDPDKVGVNIVLKPGTSSDAKITMSLVEVPLVEVLHYVAGLANLDLVVEDHAFLLQPPAKGADAGAEKPPEAAVGSPKVELTAAATTLEGEVAVAKGDASLKYADQTMKADEIRYNTRTRQVDLTGKVVVDNAVNRIEANRMSLWLTAGGKVQISGPEKGTMPGDKETTIPTVPDDMGDLFLDAYLTLRKAEQLEGAGQIEEAIAQTKTGIEKLDGLEKRDPHWQPQIVDYRKARAAEMLRRLQDKLQ